MNRSAIFDDAARKARRSLAFGLGAAFAVMGREARHLAQGLDADTQRRVLASGLVSSFSCELMRGIYVLAEGQVAYGAAALVRQLVETEYLAWAVSNDPEEAEEWLTSSKNIRLQRWQPGKIRQRSDNRFPNTDYHAHCEFGGHPTPEGGIEILDNRLSWVEMSLHDACLHGSNTWHYLLDAFADIEAFEKVDSSHQAVDVLIETWRRDDRLNLEGGPEDSPVQRDLV